MTEQRTGFRFDIYERVHLPEDRPAIGELEQIELLPHVSGLPGQEQTQLKGHLQLTAVYASEEEGGEKQTFDHFIPVEISLPVRSSDTDGEVQVQIDQFDVELLSNRSLNVTGVLLLTGWGPQTASEHRSTDEDEIVAIHQAGKPVSQQIKLVTEQSSDSFAGLEEQSELEGPAAMQEEEEAQPVWEPFSAFGAQAAQDESMDEDEFRESSSNGLNIASYEPAVVEEQAEVRAEELAESQTESLTEEKPIEPKIAFKPQSAQRGAASAESIETSGIEKKNNELEWRKLFLGAEEENHFKKMRMCIVQKEETIQSIAERYQLHAREIALYNRLGESDVAEGQVIYIPSR